MKIHSTFSREEDTEDKVDSKIMASILYDIIKLSLENN